MQNAFVVLRLGTCCTCKRKRFISRSGARLLLRGTGFTMAKLGSGGTTGGGGLYGDGGPDAFARRQ